MFRTVFGLALIATLVALPSARASELTIIIENVTQEKGLLHIAVLDESGYKVDGKAAFDVEIDTTISVQPR